MLESHLVTEPRGQRCFEPHKPLLSLSWKLAPSGLRRLEMTHTVSVDSRIDSDSPGARTEPRRVPVLIRISTCGRARRGMC